MAQSNVRDALQRARDTAMQAEALVVEGEAAQWEAERARLTALVEALAAALVAGRITLLEWQAAMRQAILQSHTLAYAIARGGLALLTPADVRRIEARVATQAGFLAQWVGVIGAAGTALTVAGRAVSARYMQARAAMYIEEAGGSLEAGKAAAIGLPELPAYPKDGTTRCLTRCYCSWRIRQVGEADWDCFWLLGSADHCEHCPRRALSWQPLRVRDGILQPYTRAGLFLQAR